MRIRLLLSDLFLYIDPKALGFVEELDRRDGKRQRLSLTQHMLEPILGITLQVSPQFMTVMDPSELDEAQPCSVIWQDESIKLKEMDRFLELFGWSPVCSIYCMSLLTADGLLQESIWLSLSRG